MKRCSLVFLLSLVVIHAGSTAVFAQSTSISLYSQPGDPFGGDPNTNGKHFTFSDSDGSFTVLAFDYTHDNLVDTVTLRFLSFDGRNNWNFQFSTAGTGSNMSPGYYDNGGRWLPGGYGMNVGNGGGCLSSTSTFCITEARFDYSNPLIPRVVSFAAGFEFHCYGQIPALVGSVAYLHNSSSSGSCVRLTATGGVLPEIEVGHPFAYKIDVVGGVPPYDFMLQQGQLPPGLVFNSTGEISGTPSTAGDYTVGVYITDSVQISGSDSHIAIANYSFKVIVPPPRPLSIEGTQPPKAVNGASYTHRLVAIGGMPPYKWGVAAGSLPTGLGLDSDGGIRGTPSAPGVFSFQAQVTDAATNIVRQSYSITVIDPPRITNVIYKVKKNKLTIEGELFDSAAKLYLDGNEIRPSQQDATFFFVKKLSLAPGDHEVRVVNPDGGTATIKLTV